MREGNKIHPLVKIDRSNLMQLADVVTQEFKVFKPNSVVIDVGGVGGGLYDILATRSKIKNVLKPFDGSNNPTEEDTYRNRRAEAYWGVRNLLSEGELDFPDDESIEGQFTGIRYQYASHRGHTVVKLESKEDMRKRGMQSPNEADAIVMACEEGFDDDEAGQGVWF